MIKCDECKVEFNSDRSLSNHLRGGCRNSRIYEKNCPVCNIIIKYESPGRLEKSIINNSKCPKCCNKGREQSDDTKNKISEKLKTLYDTGEIVPNMTGAHSCESRKKMKNTKTGTTLDEEHKLKIKNSALNSIKVKIAAKDPLRNKKISNKLKGRRPNKETRRKMSENRPDISGDKNPSKRPEVRLKLRLKLIERISNNLKLDGKIIMPFFNRKACEYFDKIMSENKCNIQHALNGGEFYVKELGYFLDGYDVINNIAYEWDEYHHFKSNGELIDDDVIRQNEIVSTLGCSFIRIKQDDYIS